MEKPVHFASIQVLRAVAALLVLMLHVDPAHFVFGWVGVDLFFVISGFIMGTLGLRDTPARFIIKRMVRIAPLYWLATSLIVGVVLVMPKLLNSLTFDATTYAKSLLFIPYFNEQRQIWPLLPPGWTLNFEMFFYALFALSLLLPHPRVTVLALLVGLVALGTAAPVQSAPFEVWTSPRLLEFGAGVAISMLPRLPGARVGFVLLALGTALLVHAMATFPTDDPPVWDRIAFCLPGLSLMVVGALGVENGGRWPRMKVAEYLGDISYSLYLLHFFVVTALHKLLPSGLVSGLVSVALSIVVAGMSHAVIEVWLSNRLRRAVLARA